MGRSTDSDLPGGDAAHGFDVRRAAERPAERDGAERDGADRPASQPAAGEELPARGRLVWFPPEGPPREVTPSGHSLGEFSADEGDGRSCPRCGGSRAVETLVREHVECGYVGFDGFVRAGRDAPPACPKCGTVAEAGERFPAVATIFSCVRCGLPLDRPFERDGDGR